jgi:hypothetical protein
MAQKGGERSLADPTVNGEVAPIPVVREATIEPLESTLSGHSLYFAGRSATLPVSP